VQAWYSRTVTPRILFVMLRSRGATREAMRDDYSRRIS
jgi:hypothetical protein